MKIVWEAAPFVCAFMAATTLLAGFTPLLSAFVHMRLLDAIVGLVGSGGTLGFVETGWWLGVQFAIYVGTTVRPLSPGEIVMYAGAFGTGLGGLRQIMENLTGTCENLLFLGNYLELQDIRPTLDLSRRTKPVPAPIDCVAFEGVTFRYPGMDHDVLRNVSFRLEKSTNTLLVGANGAGKTTLIRLLTRLYDPTEGHIRINGIDIRELEVEGLRRAVGVVFQNFTRFTLSAYENVGLGSVEELENKEEIVNSARRAKADEFIRRFPGGYETILSRTFTGGIELSGGAMAEDIRGASLHEACTDPGV